MASLPFTDSTKNVFAESRLIALDLGYDYISTLHFFLADCNLYPISSSKGLFFKNEAEFEKFYSNMRVGAPTTLLGSVPLLREAEQSLKKAKQVCRSYRDEAIHPCHLLLAASQLPASPILNLLTIAGLTPEDLRNYYIRTGQLSPLLPAPYNTPNILSRLWQRVRPHRL